MNDETVSAKALGEWLDVSDRTVRSLADERIVARAGRGRYRLQESVINVIRHLREVAAARGGEQQILDLTQERARLAREQADGQELKNRVTRGEYVAAADVEREWAGVCRDIRAGMLTVPGRIHQKIPHLDASEVALVDREIRNALEALGDDHQHHPPAGDAGADPAAAASAIEVD